MFDGFHTLLLNYSRIYFIEKYFLFDFSSTSNMVTLKIWQEFGFLKKSPDNQKNLMQLNFDPFNSIAIILHNAL